MKDCIYRKEATEFIDKCLNHEEELQSVERETLIAVKKYLESINAADVRSVVLCRDCEWYDGRPWKNNETGICARTDVGVRKDDFCSYGEKLEEN